MKFEKAPPSLVALFDALLPMTMGERRQMFGYPAGFLNGNMFCGVFGKDIVVRLDETDRTALLKREGASTFDPMGGRPMKEYVIVPSDMLDDEAAVIRWLKKAEAYAESLPPKLARKPVTKKPAAKPRAKK
jgi:TfoX/Sxy family transcriptional regulator of competence genes